MRDNKINFLINGIYYLSITLAVVFLSRFALKNLLPLILGFIIGWIVQKPSRFISKKTKIKQNISSGALAILVLVLVIGLGALVMFGLINYSEEILKWVYSTAKSMTDTLENFSLKLKNITGNMPDQTATVITSFITKIPENISSQGANLVSDWATAAIKGVPKFLLNCIVCAVAGCYVATDFLKLSKFLKNFIGENIYKKILRIKTIFSQCIFSYLKGYLLLMVFTFIQLFVAFAIIRVNNPLLIAAVVALVDLLPILGTGTVLVPWGIIEIVFYNRAQGMAILVIYALVTITRNFAEPKIIGKQIGINPLFTLLSMFVGLKIFGFFGMILMPLILVAVIKYYKNEPQY